MKPLQCSLLFLYFEMLNAASMLQSYDDLNKTFNIEYSN